jgi:hypothetical protein
MYISIETTDAERVLHSASYEQRLQAVLFSLGVCASQCRASARYAKQVPPCSSAVPRSAGLRKEASFITKQFFAVLASKEQSVCRSITLPIPYRMGKTKTNYLVSESRMLAVMQRVRATLGIYQPDTFRFNLSVACMVNHASNRLLLCLFSRAKRTRLLSAQAPLPCLERPPACACS